MEICTICNKEFKNLGVHMRKHETPVEASVEEDFSEIEEVDTVKITPKEINSRIFKQDKDPKRPLSEFLDEYEITEDELVRLVKGSRVFSVKDKAKSDLELAEIEVEKYKNEKLAFVTNLLVADLLEKRYNFKCTEVKGPRISSSGLPKPKTWVMKKQ